MVGWILRIILIILVVRALVRFVRGLIAGVAVPVGGAPDRGRAVALVKDPVCGMYVVRERALTSGTRGAVSYFCSERCRDAFETTSGPARDAARARAGRRPA